MVENLNYDKSNFQGFYDVVPSTSLVRGARTNEVFIAKKLPEGFSLNYMLVSQPLNTGGGVTS